ncbi:arginine--tRNA ligase [Candidatus Rhodoluna planktonica]|uniref:Arginine--tRNA ligase n=1 Tax=Candidatus Rhodoluna planktonica TaxID=535712 RepID=A0A1D9DZS0_9MICO|nr:arginine--tRNA ligase [Candidatus Rhodoluna planktonica]AOY56291.1 arginine--tRNA ligase [Candidatus Rhodoluna planktonica]
MTPADLSAAIVRILASLQADGKIGDAEIPSEVVIERPKNREHGDWATNVAMQLGAKFGHNPRSFAELLAAELQKLDDIETVAVAGPGFINITLSAAATGQMAKTIVEANEAFGRGDSLAGVKLNLEFVSANPTGPIHLGGTRWAAVGDSLARVFEAQGASVTREYYFNDHGAQIDRFARSLLAKAKGEPAPEDGYGGLYIQEIAERVLAETAEDILSLPEDQAQEKFRAAGVDLMFAEIRQSLHDFGVDFDVYFHENSLYESGAVPKAIARLTELGHTFEAEGALWLRSTDFGDDRDRVIIKSDGEAAYIAGDIAYYLDKRERGFDQCIYMLGADHHGYVPRMMALCAAFGDKPGLNMEILIGQMVNLVRDGEPVRMSKRAGTVVTLEDLVEIVGTDAARYALARSSINSSLDIDLEQLTKKTNDNPVFYVQYAHARTAQVAKNAQTLNVDRSEFDPALLNHESESDLLAKLTEFPRVVAQAAEFREPHRVARYLEEVAGAYHRWYDNCRVTPLSGADVETIHRTRLWLNDAAGVVLRNGLALLGVSAPERM